MRALSIRFMFFYQFFLEIHSLHFMLHLLVLIQHVDIYKSNYLVFLKQLLMFLLEIH